jgi:excisionase family DNA binding protein
MVDPTPPKRLLNMRQVAQRLGVGVQRAYQLARENKLPVVRLGRIVRVDPDVLEDWIQKGGTG